MKGVSFSSYVEGLGVSIIFFNVNKDWYVIERVIYKLNVEIEELMVLVRGRWRYLW